MKTETLYAIEKFLIAIREHEGIAFADKVELSFPEEVLLEYDSFMNDKLINAERTVELVAIDPHKLPYGKTETRKMLRRYFVLTVDEANDVITLLKDGRTCIVRCKKVFIRDEQDCTYFLKCGGIALC